MMKRERKPGIKPLAGWRGADGIKFDQDDPNPEQLDYYIEHGAMAWLIIIIAWRLINVAEIRHIVATSKSETLILTMTFVIGVILSLGTFISHTIQPKFAVGAPDLSPSQRTFRNADVLSLLERPQMMGCCFGGPLYFSSSHMLEAEFLRVAAERPGQPRLSTISKVLATSPEWTPLSKRPCADDPKVATTTPSPMPSISSNV